MTTETAPYPYYPFKETSGMLYLEGRFWNQSGKQLAIVAVITKGVDWSAYIGTDAPDSYSEEGTCLEVARFGCKLNKLDALHFFPKITDLPYRG